MTSLSSPLASDSHPPQTPQSRYDQGNAKKKTHTNNPLKLQTDQVEKEGLGVWISILEDAADMASEANRELTWGAVIKAYCLSQAEAEMIQ